MNSHINKVMSQIKSSPWSHGRKTPSGRGKRTYDVLAIQRENGNGTKNTRKKRHLQRKKKRKKEKKEETKPKNDADSIM